MCDMVCEMWWGEDGPDKVEFPKCSQMGSGSDICGQVGSGELEVKYGQVGSVEVWFDSDQIVVR